DVVHEEIEVLEEPEHAEIRDDTQPEELAAMRGARFHPARGAIVDGRRGGDQDEKPRMDVAVEEVAAREEEDVLGPVRQPPVDRGEDQETEDTIDTIETHR